MVSEQFWRLFFSVGIPDIVCPAVLRNSFRTISAKYMHKCEHTFWQNKSRIYTIIFQSIYYICVWLRQYKTVRSDCLPFKRIAGFSACQMWPFERSFDNHFVRMRRNGGIYQICLISTQPFQLLKQLELLFNQCAFLSFQEHRIEQNHIRWSGQLR